MAEVVKKLGLPKPEAFLYFVEEDGSIWKHQGGQKSLITETEIKREIGFLYFIDLNGDLSRKPNPQQRDRETNKIFKAGTQTIDE